MVAVRGRARATSRAAGAAAVDGGDRHPALTGDARDDADADLARRTATGDREAFGLLFERWFDRAFDVAWHVVRNRDTAADVAQETFVTAWQQIGGLRQPESAGGWLLRIARNKALNRLQRERRSRPIGDEETLVTLDVRHGGDDPADPVADPVADRERDDMVWVASSALGEDDASLLNLHLRHGLGPAELADELGVQPNAVHQRLFRLKKRLGDAIGAWVLWHRGSPSCPTLQAALGEARTTGFDRAAASTILTHARRCDDCTNRRQLQLHPEALFAAVPLVVAGPLLRAQAAAAVEAVGGPGAPGTGEPGQPGGSGEPGGSQPADSGGPGESGEPTGPGGPAQGAGLPAPTSPPSVASASLRRVAIVMVAVAVVVAGVVATAARTEDDGEPSPSAVERAATDTGTDTDDGPDGRPRDSSGSGGPASSGSAPRETATSAADQAATTTTAGATAAPDPAGPTPPVPPDPSDTTTPEDPGQATSPPTIGGFRASRGGSSCRSSSEVPVVFVWSSTDATAATLGPVGGAAVDVDPSGTYETCSVPLTDWALTVTGPGGSITRTTTVR